LYTPKLHLKKFLAMPIMVAPLVLGLGGVALASNPTNPPPALPSDQIVLSGSCISASQVLAAAQQAAGLYVPGGPPAGVIVNGNWIPVAMVSKSNEYVNNSACAGPLLPSTKLPSDQISLDGPCLLQAQVMAAAHEAIDLYVPGGPPAGVIVNGTWVPAGIAANAGGFLVNGCRS
jgi:hypothetical protein